MTNQLLIEELTPAQAGLITESSTDGKDLWLNGVFMQAGLKNRNGRIYPLSEITTAVTSGQKTIAESNGIMGELDHPRTLSINLDRVSHIITKLHMEGNNAIGKAKLLNTPMGNIAKELIKSGVAIGVSSRGAGTVNESGGVSQFVFCTIDIVAQPSAPGAVPSSVLESLDFYNGRNEIIKLSEQVKHDPSSQRYFKREIEKWLSTNIFSKQQK